MTIAYDSRFAIWYSRCYLEKNCFCKKVSLNCRGYEATQILFMFLERNKWETHLQSSTTLQCIWHSLDPTPLKIWFLFIPSLYILHVNDWTKKLNIVSDATFNGIDFLLMIGLLHFENGTFLWGWWQIQLWYIQSTVRRAILGQNFIPVFLTCIHSGYYKMPKKFE